MRKEKETNVAEKTNKRKTTSTSAYAPSTRTLLLKRPEPSPRLSLTDEGADSIYHLFRPSYLPIAFARPQVESGAARGATARDAGLPRLAAEDKLRI